MTSLAACGDIPRNFMAPPATVKTPVYLEVQRLSRDLKQQLAPATGAYVEIWLDGERVKDGAAEVLQTGQEELARPDLKDEACHEHARARNVQLLALTFGLDRAEVGPQA